MITLIISQPCSANRVPRAQWVFCGKNKLRWNLFHSHHYLFLRQPLCNLQVAFWADLCLPCLHWNSWDCAIIVEQVQTPRRAVTEAVSGGWLSLMWSIWLCFITLWNQLQSNFPVERSRSDTDRLAKSTANHEVLLQKTFLWPHVPEQHSTLRLQCSSKENNENFHLSAKGWQWTWYCIWHRQTVSLTLVTAAVTPGMQELIWTHSSYQMLLAGQQPALQSGFAHRMGPLPQLHPTGLINRSQNKSCSGAGTILPTVTWQAALSLYVLPIPVDRILFVLACLVNLYTVYKSRWFKKKVFLEVHWGMRVSAENPIQYLGLLLSAGSRRAHWWSALSVSWHSESQLLACFLTAHIAPFVSCCTKPHVRLGENYQKKKKKKKAIWSLTVKQCCQSICNFHWSHQNPQENRVRHSLCNR